MVYVYKPPPSYFEDTTSLYLSLPFILPSKQALHHFLTSQTHMCTYGGTYSFCTTMQFILTYAIRRPALLLIISTLSTFTPLPFPSQDYRTWRWDVTSVEVAHNSKNKNGARNHAWLPSGTALIQLDRVTALTVDAGCSSPEGAGRLFMSARVSLSLSFIMFIAS